ncbi:ATP-binding cassette domain-containing protein [Nesterenkonia sp. PF2B19]|uniref:ATP-binding cassette domain-containing protein n=1 Tax=Nesterenkonia sp. PF2B19 TaxID=1881858 RepID=UPI000871DB85|nr:ABC transporter ATP-binding protein [Nesterenkonia sp. PF2B19]OSM42270.1 ABC transporter ATP-binding protein [Nesterenkonia sp. PF2B19]
MGTAIDVRGVTRRYRSTTALDQVSVSFEKDMIHGLLGRNGAGKTSLMSVITAQDWPSEGEIRVLGHRPQENEQVLPNICFVREEQQYFDDAKAHHAFRAAAMAFPNWDQELCDRLAEEFRVPEKTRIKKMSRGQRSAVGVIIGIASRAEVTFFDEPYMGLDAVARQLFYDRLLEDYAQHPRTIVLSSHLIDEIAHLIENVVLIDRGRIILDEPVEQLRDRAVTLVGRADAVAEIAAGREVLHEETMGRMTRATVLGALDDGERRRVEELDIDIVPVSLQQLVVRLTAREQKEEAR